MAGTQRGSMRPYQPSKGHNFLVVGLIFAVMVLCYNYWSASATKNQQTYEISAMLPKLRLADSRLKVCAVF